MEHIVARRVIPAPIEDVFDRLVDHARYKDFNGIDGSDLVKEGSSEKNGVGAVRNIKLGFTKFTEEIVEFDRPTRMGYQIIKTNLPTMKHHGGLVRFSSTAEGHTQVEWTSDIEFTLPWIGGLMEGSMKTQGEKGFGSILKQVERELTQK